MGVNLSWLVVLVLPVAAQEAANGFRTAAAPDAKVAAPAKPLSPEMRGDIFMARKMYREAAEMYKQAPETAVTANKIGIAYHQVQDLNMAKRYYERAIKLDPAYSEAVNNLGTVFYAQKSYRRAIGQYKKALRIKPDSASMISNLGTAYFARKNYELAQSMWQKAAELDPEVFERRSSQGTLLQDRSVEEQAKMHYTLAKVYAKTGKTDLAISYIRKALEEGFKEKEKFRKEPEFAALQDNDEFKKLMATEPRVL